MPKPFRRSIVIQIVRGCAYSAVLLGLVVILLWVFWLPLAREKARQQSCASNLKQLSMAALAYAQDYDGRFPLKPRPGGDWMAWQWSTWRTSEAAGPLMAYVKNYGTCWCPSDRAFGWKPDPYGSYLWNDALCGKLIGECNGKPLVWDREPWHRHQRNVARVDGTVETMESLPPQ